MPESEEVVPSIPPKGKEISNNSEVVPPSSNESEFMFPMINAPLQNQERDHGPGIYAVPYHPQMDTFLGVPPSIDLIPLTYSIPRRINPAEGAGEQQDEQARDQQGMQRQVVVRRFQFAIHLDLFLILKLLAVVVLFNQDGSRQRLLTLVCFAMVVYLHQTGALTPLIRWLRRQTVPPPLPQPESYRPVRRVDEHPPVGTGDENAPGAAEIANQNQHVENGGMPADNEAAEVQIGHWWGIAQEIKMFVVGFITSLLPGFHPHND